MPALLLLLLAALQLAAPQDRLAPQDSVAQDSTAQAAPVSYDVAPDAARRGVVWSPPQDLAQAEADLQRMRQSGVRAVRTGLIREPALLSLLDRYGIVVYQDLPVARQPAATLAEDREDALFVLGKTIELAQGHPSVRAFGLAEGSDTSDQAAQPYFADLTQRAREAGYQTYYVTRFIEQDRASELVDFVLLDVREQEDARQLLRRWRRVHDTPVGVGALGTFVRPGVDGGYTIPNSRQAQARYLENQLDVLAQDSLAALFVYRWRDIDGGPTLGSSAEPSYGLLQVDGPSRPAFDVMTGFFTGRQTVFAFDAGNAVDGKPRTLPFVLLGWVVLILMTGVALASSRFTRVASRYFTRHSFYREDIRRGKPVEGWVHFALGGLLALCAGVLLTSILTALWRGGLLGMATSQLLPRLQGLLAGLLGQPFVLIGFVALIYLLLLMLNMLWLSVLTVGKRKIKPDQALTLVVWPRWPLLVLLLGAMVLGTLSPETASTLAPLLLLAWFVVEIVAVWRMTFDFSAISRVPMERAVLVGFGVPFALVTIGSIIYLVTIQDELTFFWHLITRT